MELIWQPGKIEMTLGFSRSLIDLSSQGATYSSYLPDMLSNVLSVDKTVDVKSKVAIDGGHLGLKGKLTDRILLEGNLRYLTAFLNGDINLWNSFFFGIIKKFDQAHIIPGVKVNLVVGDAGIKYSLGNNVELSYIFKQVVPVAVEGLVNEKKGEGTETSDLGMVSGGNTQRFSLAYYF
jgi:hypothetical protein